MKHFIYQLKRVKPGDYLQLWKLLPSLAAAPFFRLRHRDLWIVCEDPNEARDNGYWFFKYMREEHPEQECLYAIRPTSPDFDKVASLGPTVAFGTLRHWIIYFASSVKISSQKAGNPNAAIFHLLEVYGFIKNKRIFLQHGITKDDSAWLYYGATKMTRFICGAYPEYSFISERFGYPEGYVKYTGFCRFDGLHEKLPDERLILIMPTWRAWIADEDFRLKKYEGTTDVTQTDYFRSWVDFIRDERLEELAKTYNVKFIFFPHRKMQKYLHLFPSSTETVEIAGGKTYDVQQLMKRASMMVTDYSSVFFDMIYMEKPVVFYQFDYEAFRERQYAEGYFSYENNPFGKSYRSRDGVFDEMERLIRGNFEVSETFLEAHRDYFRLYDTDNCRRVYDVAAELAGKEK